MRKLPLILVEWDDISGTAGWATEKQVEESETIPCVTVGWQVKSTAKKLITVATRNNLNEYSDRSTIPKGCIRSIRRLE